MTTKILVGAALLLAACGTTPATKEAVKVPETKTAVIYGPEIALVQPDLKSGLTINEALQNRHSSREYAAEPLTLEELSGVMWAACGVNRPETGMLTAPTAQKRYPIHTYAVFAEGVYSYDAKTLKLTRVLEGDYRKMVGMQDYVFAAPLNLVFVADMSVYEGSGLSPEMVRYLCGQDAAGYAENVNLYAAGHGLKSVTRGSAPADELLKALNLDASRYFLALEVTVGK